MGKLLEFKKFSAYYRQKKDYVVALDEITFSVEDGEFLVIVGASGCGKTTLLKCVLGMCAVTSGEAFFNGEKLTAVKKNDKQIAYVSQEYSLYPTMTVYENIAFPLRNMHTPIDELDKRVRKMAETLEIDWLLSLKPKQLSGGQHQRVAIARALIKKPRILLMDEPFANLHPDLRLQMRELIKKIHNEQRITVIFVTHDIAEAMGLADRIIVLKDGKIEQIGTPRELEENPQAEILKEFFGK